MSRYIDADALVKRLKHSPLFLGTNMQFKDGVVDLVEKQPTADVAEVRHGKWIYHECVSSYDGAKSGYSCSACNAFVDEEVFDTDEFHKNFCGNCGAKMDGERKEG